MSSKRIVVLDKFPVGFVHIPRVLLQIVFKPVSLGTVAKVRTGFRTSYIRIEGVDPEQFTGNAYGII